MSEYGKTDSNFHTTGFKDYQSNKASPLKLAKQKLEDFEGGISGYFMVGRRPSGGDIFEKKDRGSQSVIQTNFSKTDLKK